MDLEDGKPLSITFDKDDLKKGIYKNFVMRVPKGENTLTLQLQPNITASKYKFKPFLYYKIIDDLGEQIDQIDFPPNGNTGFKIKMDYEGNGFLQVTKKIDITNDDAGLLLSIYNPPYKHAVEESAGP